jgi:hypothetical protein
MGRQRAEGPSQKDPRRKPGKKLLDATMFVKWAIIKLLITMHLAMPADIFTKAVDLETHTQMRDLMMNIPWAAAFYRRVGLPPEREAAGRNTSSSNTEPVLETAHEDAERDDEHLVGNTAKLTRLLKASTDTLSLMA